MNSGLFAKMDQVFSKENKTLKKYWKFGKKILEKSGNFVSPEKWEPCLRHILGPFLVIFEICHLLTISGPFEYFSENGWSQKIAFYSETDGPHLDIQIWF